MVTQLTVERQFPSSPSAVFDMLLDPGIVHQTVVAVGGEGATVVSHEGDRTRLTIVTQSPVDPASLPAALRPMIRSDARGTKTENWKAVGEGYVAEFDISVPGAPASVSAVARLASHPNGSNLVVEGKVEVKIPVLGPKIEKLLVDQVSSRLAIEYDFLGSLLT